MAIGGGGVNKKWYKMKYIVGIKRNFSPHTKRTYIFGAIKSEMVLSNVDILSTSIQF